MLRALAIIVRLASASPAKMCFPVLSNHILASGLLSKCIAELTFNQSLYLRALELILSETVDSAGLFVVAAEQCLPVQAGLLSFRLG